MTENEPLEPPPCDPVDVDYASTGRFHLHVPDAPSSAARRVLLLVHGYGQDPRELLAFGRRVAPDAVLAAPEGPSAFRRRRSGLTAEPTRLWISTAGPSRSIEDLRNDRFLDAVLTAVGDRVPLDPQRTFVLGFSQGAGVALHWLTGRPDAARGLVGLAGGFAAAYRERLEQLAGRPVLWVSGSRDPAYPPAYVDDLVAALATARVGLDDRRLEAGHDLLDEAADTVSEWLLREAP